MQRTIILLIVLIGALQMSAQQTVNKIKLSGFRVSIVPADQFSYEYDKTQPVKEELTTNSLTLKAIAVKKDEAKNLVVINYVDIQSLELENCELVTNSPLTLNKLTISLDKSSSINLALNVKELKAEVKGASQLGLEGTVNKAQIDLKKSSSFKSYNLDVKNIDIKASSKSTAHVHVLAEKVDLSLSSESKLTIAGQTNKLTAKAKGKSSIDANAMTVKKASTYSKSNSSIAVKAQELKNDID